MTSETESIPLVKIGSRCLKPEILMFLIQNQLLCLLGVQSTSLLPSLYVWIEANF